MKQIVKNTHRKFKVKDIAQDQDQDTKDNRSEAESVEASRGAKYG